MPGILPMKIIKIGMQAQARIAQACDRCRSKKIRCDGVRPSCSQCVNVGFECKTSDKLSRRAFPRGYTESLEERVRSLELEVRELKALLDDKDESIDILSRMHSNSAQSRKALTTAIVHHESIDLEKDAVFKVTQSLVQGGNDDSNSYLMGSSSGQMLIDAFNIGLEDAGYFGHKASRAFYMSDLDSSYIMVQPQSVIWKAPARLVSDQLVNIFFQEWTPLFPIIHRPTFLAIYEDYVSCPETVQDKHSLAQLHLIFSIAAHSSISDFSQEIRSFDSQWEAALEHVLMDGSLTTLQVLLLAQIRCLQKADYSRLLNYKALAIGLSQRLGLHQAQHRFALGALTSEIRKKLFWTMYTLDCFSAAQLGLPRMMKEEDIGCEYPLDVDDEYITEEGFLATLPGESTKVSSALALFKASRILARVLSEMYPSSLTYEISFLVLDALADELDQWRNDLPSHLRLDFLQGKPSTNLVCSRSPLLSLGYHYIRSLIYRPVVCASSTIGGRAGSAIVALAASSKHIVQIIELLSERSLAFTFCLHKHEILILSGFGILFPSLTRKAAGALNRSNHNLIQSITETVEQAPSMASREFLRIKDVLVVKEEASSRSQRKPLVSRHNSDVNVHTTRDTLSSTQKHIRSMISRFSYSKSTTVDDTELESTLPEVSQGHCRNSSQVSVSSTSSEPTFACSSGRLSFSPQSHGMTISTSPSEYSDSHREASTPVSRYVPYLDYLPLGPSVATRTDHTSAEDSLSTKREVHSPDWERIFSSLDSGQISFYDTTCGETLDRIHNLPTSQIDTLPQESNENPLAWPLDPRATNPSVQPAPQSELSFSDESLTSGEEFADLTSIESFGRGCNGNLMPDMYACSVDGLKRNLTPRS